MLEWSLFEIMILYLAETVAIMYVYFIERYFINKKTRYPFVFATIQLIFLTFFFGGLMFGYSIVLHGISNIGLPPLEKPIEATIEDLINMKWHFVLLLLFLLEVSSYVKKWMNLDDFEEISFKRTMRRFLFTHLFIFGALIICLILPFHILIVIFIIVGMKIILDYMVEDELFVNKILNQLKKKISKENMA